jgi:hypothetical protein
MIESVWLMGGIGRSVMPTSKICSVKKYPLYAKQAYAVLLGVFVLTACVAQPRAEAAGSSGPNTGPYIRSVSGWSHVDRDTIVLYSGPNDAYRVDVLGMCSDLPFAETIALDSRGGPSKISSGNISTIYVNGNPCSVTKVEKLPDDFSLAALREEEKEKRRAEREGRSSSRN